MVKVPYIAMSTMTYVEAPLWCRGRIKGAKSGGLWVQFQLMTSLAQFK